MTTSVDWTILKTAGSTATHIPETIERLSAPFHEQRHEAQFNLEGVIFDGNHMYDSSFYAIDLIVNLLAREYTVDRKFIFDLLIELSFCRFMKDEMTIQKTGERKVIYAACMEKLKKLSPVIANAVAKTYIEIELKEMLLGMIDGTFFTELDAENNALKID